MQSLVHFFARQRSALVPFALILLSCGLWPELELLVPSLPSMKVAFGVSDGLIQQLLAANFWGCLLGVLLAGALCDSLGRRVTLIYGLLAYLAAGLLASLSPSFELLLLARFLQGFMMMGPLVAAGVLLLELTAGAQQIFWLALSNSIVSFCMALGPILGTWINEAYSYQGNLWAIVLLGLVFSLPTLAIVPESLPSKRKVPFRVGALVANYSALLQDWRYVCLSLPVCFLAASYWVYVGVSALYIVDFLGLPAAKFGHYQGPILACFSVLSLASSRLVKWLGFLRCVSVGVFSMFSGVLPLFVMNLLGYEDLFWTTVFMMLFVGGMAPVVSVLFPVSFLHLPSERRGSASALLQGLRLFSAALGSFFLSFAYQGPFLPVSSLLLGALLVSCGFLWLGRGFLLESQHSVSAGGGH